MYEKITGYLDAFENGTVSDEELGKEITSFIDDFSQSGFMNPDAMQVMAEHDWATRTALRNDAPSMSAEDACACISAFVMQESFIEGIILDQIKQGILPLILKRLKELDG